MALRSAGRVAAGPRRVTHEEFNHIIEKLKIQMQQEQEESSPGLQTTNPPQDEKESHDALSQLTTKQPRVRAASIAATRLPDPQPVCRILTIVMLFIC